MQGGSGSQPSVNTCWQNYVCSCTCILTVAEFRKKKKKKGWCFWKSHELVFLMHHERSKMNLRVVSWAMHCGSSHQSLHPGRHANSDPNPWRQNRLERARDFHEAGAIHHLVYKSKLPRIMRPTAQFFCPGKHRGTVLRQRQSCPSRKKNRLQNDPSQPLKSLYSFFSCA